MMKKAADADESDPPMFARRKFSRRRLDGIATVSELSGEHFGGMHTLMRIDDSDGGVSGMTDAIIAQSTSVTVGFQSRDYIAHLGRVITCIPSEDGYRVDVAFK
jgi:hypothetical protein